MGFLTPFITGEGAHLIYHEIMQHFEDFCFTSTLRVFLLRHLVKKGNCVSVKITPWNQGDWFSNDVAPEFVEEILWDLFWWCFTDSTIGKSPLKTPPFGEKHVFLFNHLTVANPRMFGWFLGVEKMGWTIWVQFLKRLGWFVHQLMISRWS